MSLTAQRVRDDGQTLVAHFCSAACRNLFELDAANGDGWRDGPDRPAPGQSGCDHCGRPLAEPEPAR